MFDVEHVHKQQTRDQRYDVKRQARANRTYKRRKEQDGNNKSESNLYSSTPSFPTLTPLSTYPSLFASATSLSITLLIASLLALHLTP
jgi:uncharacterized membrane protein YccC